MPPGSNRTTASTPKTSGIACCSSDSASEAVTIERSGAVASAARATSSRSQSLAAVVARHLAAAPASCKAEHASGDRTTSRSDARHDRRKAAVPDESDQSMPQCGRSTSSSARTPGGLARIHTKTGAHPRSAHQPRATRAARRDHQSPVVRLPRAGCGGCRRA